MRLRVPDHRRYRRHLDRELDNVALYRSLAAGSEGEHREVLLELAAAEERHAEYWRAKLVDLGMPAPPATGHRAGLGSRSLAWLARRVGVSRVVPLLERVEAGERARYDLEPGIGAALAADEQVHAHLVASLAPAWRARAASSVRAAVFGVNDGLVSNLSLVMGMAGGNASTKVVLLAGVAGLVAGAASMAAGEFISVKSQRELVDAGTILGSVELAAMAERDPVAFELLIRAHARAAAGDADRDGGGPRADGAADVAGLGSPLAAAAYSFVAFAGGAFVPVAPFLVAAGTAALVTAAALAAVALFLVGAGLSLVTNRPAATAGLRQLAIGGIAATLTYLVGRAVGLGLS